VSNKSRIKNILICIILFFTPTLCFSWEYEDEIYLTNNRKIIQAKIIHVDSEVLTVYVDGWLWRGYPSVWHSYAFKEMLKGDTTNMTILSEKKWGMLKIIIPLEEAEAIQGKSPIIAGLWGVVGFGAGHHYARDKITSTILMCSEFIWILAVGGSWGHASEAWYLIPICNRAFDIIFAPMAADKYNKELQLKYGLPIKISADIKKQNIQFTYNVLF